MEWLSRRRCRRGHRGGIEDRADYETAITAATVALRHGYNPLDLLSKEGVEKVVMEMALNRLERIRVDEEEKRMQRMEIAVQNGVAKAFGGNK